ACPAPAQRRAEGSCHVTGQRLPERCGDQRADALLVEPGGERRPEPALERRSQLVVVAQRRGRERAGDERAASLARDDETLALEVAVCLRDGGRLDGEVGDDFGQRRKLNAAVA